MPPGGEEQIVLALRLNASSSISEMAKLDNRLAVVTRNLRELKKQGKQTTDTYKDYKTTQIAIREEKKRLGREIRKQVSDWQKFGKAIPKDSVEGMAREAAELRRVIRSQTEDVRKNNKVIGELGITYEQAKARSKSLRDEVRRQDKQMGDFTSNIGNYNEAIVMAIRGQGSLGQNMGIATQRMLTYAGPLAAIAGITRGLAGIMRDGTRVSAEYNESFKKLESITGLTGEMLEDLKSRSIDLSRQLSISAKDINNAFALVGSAAPELLKIPSALEEVTKQAIILQRAGGLELNQAVEAVTKTMNIYNLSANRAGQVTDILATAQQKGTARVEALTESLKNGGPAAAALNVTLEDSLAILQGFAKGGKEGADAGTAYRQVLNRLAKTGRDEFNPSIVGGVGAINNLADANLDYLELLDIFGEKGVTSAAIVIEQVDAINELDGALNDVGNALEQSSINTDTAAFAAQQATVAYENYLLSIDSGEGFFTKANLHLKGFRQGFFEVARAVNEGEITWWQFWTQNLPEYAKDLNEARVAQEKLNNEIIKGVTELAGLESVESEDTGGLAEFNKKKKEEKKLREEEDKRIAKEKREKEKQEEADRKRKERKAERDAKARAEKERRDAERREAQRIKDEQNAVKKIEDLRNSLINDDFDRKIAELRTRVGREIVGLSGTPEQIEEQKKLLNESLDAQIAIIEQKRKEAIDKEDQNFKKREEKKRVDEEKLGLLQIQGATDAARLAAISTIENEEELQRQLRIIKLQGQINSNNLLLENERLHEAERNALLLENAKKRGEISKIQNEAQTEAAEDAAAEQQRIQDDLNRAYQEGFEQLGEAFSLLFSGQEDAMRAFGLAVLGILLDVLENAIRANAIAAFAVELGTKGLFGLPQGLVAQGLVLGLIRGLRGLINFKDGGFLDMLEGIGQASLGTYAGGGAIDFPAKTGGEIRGPSHSKGGVPFVLRKGGRAYVGEAEGGEVIMNKAQVKKAKAIYGNDVFAQIGVPGEAMYAQDGAFIPQTVSPSDVRVADPQGFAKDDFDYLIEGIGEENKKLNDQTVRKVTRAMGASLNAQNRREERELLSIRLNQI